MWQEANFICCMKVSCTTCSSTTRTSTHIKLCIATQWEHYLLYLHWTWMYPEDTGILFEVRVSTGLLKVHYNFIQSVVPIEPTGVALHSYKDIEIQPLKHPVYPCCSKNGTHPFLSMLRRCMCRYRSTTPVHIDIGLKRTCKYLCVHSTSQVDWNGQDTLLE